MRSEQAIQQAIRLAAPRYATILYRNNVGACQTADGRQIRYGLANDSAQINREFKSSDLIGITRRVITSDMVGQIIGIFTSIEVKREGWSYHGTEREQAQQRWIELIQSNGGIAQFATGPASIWPGEGV